MKKILVAIVALLCISSGSFAQKKKTTKDKTEVKPPPAPAKVKPAPGPLKKDGTPDMRYKVNKEAAKPTGPLKKDGTPDMRYKSNKPAVPAKKKP